MKKFETIQEAADYAVLKMVEQGGRCVDENWNCAYEGLIGGSKGHCAVGHLVCDSISLDVEGEISYAAEYFFDSVNYELIKNNLTFFGLIQKFHDAPSKTERQKWFYSLSVYIDTSKPQYKQWVEMV